MDEFGSRKYESIDALIMAAEVLERAELMTQKQLSFEDNYGINNVKLNNVGLANKDNQNCNLTDNLIQTIDCIQECGMWNGFSESKNKSKKEMIYCELNDLKKKINQMKRITSKVREIVTHDENEDTPTASEDEGYNKYNANDVNNFDDITDDASECEETSKIPNKLKSDKSKVIRNKRIKVKSFIRGDTVSNPLCYISRDKNRKRKSSNNTDFVNGSSKDRLRSLCNPSITRLSQNVNDISCISAPFTYLQYPSDYKTILKIHQAVDI